MFVKLNDNNFKIIGQKKDGINSSLEKGMYNLSLVNAMVPYLKVEKMTRYDNSKVIKAGIFSEACEYISEHFDPIKIELRKSMGMLNKLNLMFDGSPGTGKTHLACTVAKDLIDKYNGIGVVLSNIVDIQLDEMVDNLRINDDPSRLIVIVLDELEKNPQWCLKSSKFLGFLDGANSRDNIVIISTVNSIEDLPDFLTSRPGRFEKIYKFTFSDINVISTISKGLLPEKYKNNEDLLLSISKNAIEKGINTIDHLRFFILNGLYHLEKKGVLNFNNKIETIVKEDTIEINEIIHTTLKVKDGKEDECIRLLKKTVESQIEKAATIESA